LNGSTVYINTSTFTNCSANEYGGAIVFSSNTTFSIKYSNLTLCSAELRGGAIASFSSISGVRVLENCKFEGNSLFPADRLVGIDIYDGSNYATAYYTPQTVVNCTSTSIASSTNNDILFAGSVAGNSTEFTVFDCLLTGSCDFVAGTYVSLSSGQDYTTCGTTVSPCLSLMYAVNKTASDEWINIMYDQNPYYLVSIQFPARTVLIRGLESNTTSQKPILQTNFSSSSYMIYYYQQNSYTTMSNFLVKYDLSQGSGNSRYLIYVYADSGQLSLEFCFYV
jgi:hypothetical protein